MPYAIRPLTEVAKLEITAEQRLFRKVVKKSKDNPNPTEVSVGAVMDKTSYKTFCGKLEESAILQDYILKCYHSLEDEVLKNSRAIARGCIIESDYDLIAVEAHLTAVVERMRFSGKFVENWFASHLSVALGKHLQQRLGFPEEMSEAQSEKIAQMLRMYRDQFSKLAQRDHHYDAAIYSKLETAILLADENQDTDAVVERFEKATPIADDML